MITDKEKMIALINSVKWEDVKSAYISRARLAAGRISTARQWMLDNGFELIDLLEGPLLTDDGREILRAHGRALALRPEIHAQRLAEAMEVARKRDAAIAEQRSQPTQPSQPPTTCTSLIDGQLCGGNLVRAAVCPRGALGKQGVAATLTCDVCGHVTAVMRGDK